VEDRYLISAPGGFLPVRERDVLDQLAEAATRRTVDATRLLRGCVLGHVHELSYKCWYVRLRASRMPAFGREPPAANKCAQSPVSHCGSITGRSASSTRLRRMPREADRGQPGGPPSSGSRALSPRRAVLADGEGLDVIQHHVSAASIGPLLRLVRAGSMPPCTRAGGRVPVRPDRRHCPVRPARAWHQESCAATVPTAGSSSQAQRPCRHRVRPPHRQVIRVDNT
jgi:hypothetical protein